MRTRLRSTIVGVATLTIAGSLLAFGAGVAQAVTPGWVPDANSAGGLYFYNAAGHQITSGLITDSPLAAYYVASGGGINAGNNRAFEATSTPVQGSNSATWPGTQQISSTQTFPPAGALPGDLAGFTGALVNGVATDGSLNDTQIAAFPNSSAVSGFQGMYEVRMYTTGGAGGQSSTWYSATIQVTGSSWAQVFPVQTSTTTTLAPPTTPIASGTNVTLNATVAPASAGKVQFFDGATAVGTPQTVTGGSGAASIVVTAPAVGSHPYSAVFTPTPGTANLGSTSTTQTVVVTGPAISTTTTLSVNVGTGVAFSPVGFSANVTPVGAAPVGTVTFKEGAVTLGTSSSHDTTTPFTFSTSGLGTGSHTVVATFNAPSGYNNSDSAPQTFSLTAPACAGGGTACVDTQNIQADIAAGTIVVNTPYHAGNPLDVPLNLDPSASFYTGSATFQNIQVTDTRAGNLPWDLKAQASSLVFGANTINGQNVGLTGFSITGVPTVSTAAGNLTITNAPAASPPVAAADPGTLGLGNAQHTIVHANQGVGTIAYNATLTINAPTSVPAGTYTGTITFTVG